MPVQEKPVWAASIEEANRLATEAEAQKPQKPAWASAIEDANRNAGWTPPAPTLPPVEAPKIETPVEASSTSPTPETSDKLSALISQMNEGVAPELPPLGKLPSAIAPGKRPAPELADQAAGQGAGGGGGAGWGEEDKGAPEPATPPAAPERTGVLGVIDKGTELAGKVLGSMGSGAAVVHGQEPWSPEQQAAADLAGREVVRGALKGRTFGLYQPPELTEGEKKLGADWAQTVGDFIGMGGAIKSVASSVSTAAKGLGLAPEGIRGAGNIAKIAGEAGVTGFFYDLLNRVGSLVGADAAGGSKPEFGGGMIAQGLALGANYLGQPEVAQAIVEGTKKLGPGAMALDFMGFALGGVGVARLLTPIIEQVHATQVAAQAEAQAKGFAEKSFDWKTQDVDEALNITEQVKAATAPKEHSEVSALRSKLKGLRNQGIESGDEVSAINEQIRNLQNEHESNVGALESRLKQAQEENSAFKTAALYSRMGDEFRDENGNLLPADQIEAKLNEVQARVEAEKQAIRERQATEATKEAPAPTQEAPAPGQPIFISEGENDIAPTSTKVLNDLRAKATETPDDAWVMRGKAMDMPKDPEALQLIQKGLVDIRQDDQGNLWMRAAGEYPEAPVQAAAPPETPSTLAEEAAPTALPKVSQDADGWWRVEGSDNKFSTEGQAQNAAKVIGKYRPAESAEPTAALPSTPTPLSTPGDETIPRTPPSRTPATTPGNGENVAPGASGEAVSAAPTAPISTAGDEVTQAAQPSRVPPARTTSEAPTLETTAPTPEAPKAVNDLWYDNTAFPAGTYTKEAAGGPVTITGNKLGDYIVFDATQWSGEKGWMIFRITDGRSMTGTRAFKKREDALGYVKDLHDQDLEEKPVRNEVKPWQMSKDDYLNSWYEGQGDVEHFSDVYEDGEPSEANATLFPKPEGYTVVREGDRLSDRQPIKNPDTGDIYFDTPEAAKLEYHRQEVMRAKAAGEKVPEKVLAQYPETKQGDLFSVKKPLPSGIAPKKPQPAASLQAEIEKSKAAGNIHLDQIEPKEGMKVKDLATGETGTLSYDSTPTSWGGVKGWVFNGEREVDSSPARYVVQKSNLPSGITGKALRKRAFPGAEEQGAEILPRVPQAAQYVTGIKNKDKGQYAGHYELWLRQGRPEGTEPEVPPGLGTMAAQAVRLQLDKFYPEQTSEPLPSALTGKKTGAVSQAKPVARHPGLPAGIAPTAKVPETPESVPTPEFKVGDRVSWSEYSHKLGKNQELTGTIESGPRNGEVDIKVDQIAHIGGVIPIGRVSVGVKTANLTKLKSKEKSEVSIEKPKKEPIISDKETSPETPEGGKGNVETSVLPGKTSENDRGSLAGKGPKNISSAKDAGKTPKVPEESRPGNDEVVQSGGSDNPSPESGTESEGRPQDDSGRKRSPEPVHGGTTGDLAGVQRPPDYRVSPGELKRPGGWKATAAQNLDIIELVKKLEAEGRYATPEEQALLVQYTGFGAGEIRNNLLRGYSHRTGKIDLYKLKDDWQPLAERLESLVTPAELAEIAQSTQYAHYTSEPVIRSIYKALEKMGFPGGRVLEPGMGNGLFGGLMPDAIKDASTYTGIERDSVTALVAKHLLPNQNIMRADFIKQKLPDNFFDLGIGNPPFARTVIEADPRYAKLRFTLHDYFFAKTIDKVRPGGLLVFVTSRYTMDKAADKARQYLADRADLIGAIRLPQTAFKENAGTEVVTDVLFLRKRAEGEPAGGFPWLGQKEVQTPEGPARINEYFADHPEMILGRNSLQGTMYSDKEYTVLPHDGNIEAHFDKAVEHLPKNVYSIVKLSPEEQRKVVIERDFNPKIKKEGGLYIDDKGNLMVVEQGTGISVEGVAILKTLSNPDKTWLKDYVPLRDALKQAQYDQWQDGDWEKSLKALNKVYDAFVKKYGRILEYSTFELPIKEDGVQVLDEYGNKLTREYKRFKNQRRLRADIESPLVFALENITDAGEIVKGEALRGRVVKPPQRIEPKTPFEALAVTLDEVGKLDLNLIASKLNISREEAIEALGDMIYKDPGSTWQTSDKYLSGDVVTKLEEARAAAKADPQYQRNVEALELVQPIPLTPAQVKVNLGSPWVPVDYVTQFAREILGVQHSIIFNPQVNVWKVNYVGRQGRNQTSEWGTADRSAAEILDHVLNNQTLVIKRTETILGVKKTWTDEAATTRVNEIAKSMRDRFASWVWGDVHRADDLLGIYNRKYNNLAGRKFDGSHLTLPGFTSRFPLHDHQKRAIWRIIQDGNVYLNHAVGAGKTLEMICAGMEMKRLGLISKPIYVVPKHMLEQFSSDFLDAYPLANIMVADEKNFHTDNRKRFMAQAALNNPDAIIITHSSFGKVGMKPENVATVRDMFIRDLEDLLESLMEDEQANRILISKTEHRIEQLQQRFDGMTNTNTDKALTFEELGADFLIVDEAHEFRKLDFVTNRQAKGIDSNGSRKALDLYVKTLYLESQKPGRSHVFATGTPIVNTMGELFTIMRYFDDGQMEADGLHYFDAWANMFGQMVSDYEMNGAGGWEPVERFAAFINVPELMKRVRSFTDVLTPSQLGGYVSLPNIKNGQATLMLAPDSAALKRYQRDVLQPRLKRSREWKPSPGEKGNPDPVINIITDGRLASIDMRFVEPNSPSDPTSKLNLMIDEIIAQHHRTKDLPYIDKITGKEEPINGATQIVFYNHGFGKAVASKRGFDARAWVMQRFKEEGIPSSQVAWIDDYKTSAAKGTLCEEVRAGEKRILIGSCKKMGTGLNVQNRMLISHIQDPPWYPADLEQAEGRTIRQGNQNLEVIMMRWATKGSYDATMWQMVARKARVIEQAWMGDDSVRTLEDVSPVSQYQMAAAVSSGDDRAIQLAKLQGEVARLTRLREAHFAEQRELRAKDSSLSFWIPRDQEEIDKYKAAEKAVGGYVRKVSAKIGGQTFTPDDSRGDIGMAIMEVFNNRVESRGIKDPAVTYKTGKFNGFELTVTTNLHFDTVWGMINIRVTPDKEFWIHHGKPFEEIDGHAGAGLVARIVNVLNNIGRDLATMEHKLSEKKADLQRVKKRLGIPFPDERELLEQEGEVARLQSELAATGQEPTSPEVGEDIAGGLELEKRATKRTGPTAATAMRQPTWTEPKKAASFRLGGILGVKEKAYDKESTPAVGTIQKPGNRGSDLSQDAAGSRRDLADFRLRRLKGPLGKSERNLWARIEYSDTLAASSEFQAIAAKAKSRGIAKVLPVRNAPFAGAIYPESDGNIMLLNEEIGSDITHTQVSEHEAFHHEVETGNTIARRLVNAVDLKSDTFKKFRKVQNSLYDQADQPRLTPIEVAEELAADFMAGLTRVDLDGQEIDLATAFVDSDRLKETMAAHKSSKTAGGFAESKVSQFAFKGKGKFLMKAAPPKTPITPKEEKAIDKWLGQREINEFDAKVMVGNWQRAIMEALDKKKYDAECKEIDNAITHYIELKSHPEHANYYYAGLQPQDQKAVDIARDVIPHHAALKAIAEEIAEFYKTWAKKALDAEVIHDALDNFATHIWNLEKAPSTEGQRKFGTKTGHAQQRTFDTEIQGLATGYEPLVRGATNKAMIYQQDVGKTIADRQFIEGEMGKALSTKQSDKRPDQIQHPNMRGWKWAGSIEVEPIIAAVRRMSEEIKNSQSTTTKGGEQAPPTTSGPVNAMKDVVRNSLVVRGMTEDEANAYINRIEISAIKAAKGQPEGEAEQPSETPTTVIKELREKIVKIEESQKVVGHTIKPVGRKDLFVNSKGDIFQRVPLYASEGAAEKLNNILGTSALHKIPALAKAINAATKLKETILFLTGYHHQAGIRGWLLGVTGQGVKGLNIRKSYRKGLDLINAMDPVIRHGVEVGGLQLGMTPEWREALNGEKSKIGALLDKWKVSKAVKNKTYDLWEAQVNFLFGKLFPGLQSMAYITEFRNHMEKFPNADPDEAAKKIAKLCNYNFGNLNYARMGRNPTLQHILRAVFLAPQWTESNYRPVHEMAAAFAKGDKESAHIYRKFWASVFVKGLAVLLLGNLAMAMFDDKSAWESLKERWRAGRLRWLGLNITPVYRGIWRALGLEPSKSQKVFSPLGHFLDVIKMVTHPLLFLHHKGSPLYRAFHEGMAGVNWQGRPFTSAGEFTGATGSGALKGQLTKEGKSEGPVTISQLPSFILAQLRGSVPIPAGNILAMLSGEMDGFDAITKSTGTMVSSFTPKTEAQGIISDYYREALPTRNLSPREKAQKDLEKKLLAQARSGDMEGFMDALSDAVADGKLSRMAAKDLVKEAQMPEGAASFAKLPLEVALKAWDAATDQEKEMWGPQLLKKVARSQSETLMRNKEALQEALTGLGMEGAASALDNIPQPEFKPTTLNTADIQNLASLNPEQIDDYLVQKFMGQKNLLRRGLPNPIRTHRGESQKNKLRRLGLG